LAPRHASCSNEIKWSTTLEFNTKGSGSHAPTFSAISKGRLWLSYLMTDCLRCFIGGWRMSSSSLVGREATVQLGIRIRDRLSGFAFAGQHDFYLFRARPILGAILSTGYGGRVASQVRVSALSFNIILPVLLGALLWWTLGAGQAPATTAAPDQSR